MALSNEDKLRLNVLSAQKVDAIRINESSMVLSALTSKGEAQISLSPNCDHTRYLREVREFLSEKYLGMPGGYPRHLKRWTRMGVAHNSLDKMLLLGEQEAIVALAYSAHLTAEQARHAWWAHQSPEIARNLLKSSEVIHSELGPELAAFLLEFLPFEERALDIVESVQCCLQSTLIDQKARARLWERAKRKNPFFVGFMLAGPDAIPIDEPAHPDYESVAESLKNKDTQDNPYADYLLHFLSPDGRKWLKSLHLALKKPTDPDVVIAMFISVDHYIKLALAPTRGVLNIDDAVERAEQLCAANNTPKQLQFVCDRLNQAQIKQLKAMLMLAQLGENTLNSVFGGRDATGTVMRKHLQPLSTQVEDAIKTLLT